MRIGDGVIVSGPGEVFTEIGMAVKERSPGTPTLYCGYTNGAVSYFSTAEAFEEGGYEPAFSNRTYGLPAPVAPDCERLLVERGVRLAESLFPDASGTPAMHGLPLIRYQRTRRSGSRVHQLPKATCLVPLRHQASGFGVPDWTDGTPSYSFGVACVAVSRQQNCTGASSPDARPALVS